MTHLLVKIKFTSKLDIPGSLEINRLNISISLPELSINAYSFRNSPVNRYLLKI
jgi:hypothetical protein